MNKKYRIRPLHAKNTWLKNIPTDQEEFTDADWDHNTTDGGRLFSETEIENLKTLPGWSSTHGGVWIAELNCR